MFGDEQRTHWRGFAKAVPWIDIVWQEDREDKYTQDDDEDDDEEEIWSIDDDQWTSLAAFLFCLNSMLLDFE